MEALKKVNSQKTFTEIFSDWIISQAKKNKKLCAITPAMSDGSGLTKFSEKYPDRFYDVGIAEQHALTFAAGLSLSGYKPVVAIYSTFMQRAYDQLIHDIAIQNIPMLFAVDRAGVVGADGATHSGNFDISFLRCIPNIVIMAPSDENECHHMLTLGYEYEGICAVRYPRGYGSGQLISKKNKILLGKGKEIREGKDIAILCFGPLLETCKAVAEELNTSLIDMRFIKPIDETIILKNALSHKLLVIVEDNTVKGGAGSAVLEVLSQQQTSCKTLCLGIPDKFLEHGTQEEIHKLCGLDKNSILSKIVNHIDR